MAGIFLSQFRSQVIAAFVSYLKSDDRGGFEYLIGFLFCTNPLSGYGDMGFEIFRNASFFLPYVNVNVQWECGT